VQTGTPRRITDDFSHLLTAMAPRGMGAVPPEFGAFNVGIRMCAYRRRAAQQPKASVTKAESAGPDSIPTRCNGVG
jgi:hypothetical protein